MKFIGGGEISQILKKALTPINFIIVIIGIFIFVLGSYWDAEYRDALEHAPVISLSEMENDLKSNAMNAKKKYRYSIYTVKGIMDSVEPEGNYISLKSSESGNGCMRCYVNGTTSMLRDQRQHISAMQSGDAVTLKIKHIDVSEEFGYEAYIIEFM